MWHLIDNTQAEYVRILHADSSFYLLPGNMDEEAALMLSDILPTVFEIKIFNGKVKQGEKVVH
ncbi:hypothetical protein [Sodalis-like endosymbiont of Proechinophthirus fluctus]|uniref:hypothetical protein n=1 Tax=Sodalis-like endosymbiont of Proechinophthirus fluctus TaxID=1462730 RepID=UPI00082B696C|nr:hypothetical protein [Sodalis-like endosymbiont of Proechinophthirus fluctus]